MEWNGIEEDTLDLEMKKRIVIEIEYIKQKERERIAYDILVT